MANPQNVAEAIPRPPKNRGGRPRKDGAPTGSLAPTSANDIAGPRLKKYFSDSPNSTQRTRALWTWWGSAADSTKELLEAHIYRDWPVLLDPREDWCTECKLVMAPELGKCPRCGEKLKAQEYKYIDVVLGTTPFESDQDFIDRYGAGDYHVYLNANPPGAQRRTLAEAWVKGTHDFRTYRPTDKRIDNIEQVDLSDPQNASYIAHLRANGKLPEEEREKEKEEMAASGVLVEKLLDRVDNLTDRFIEKNVEPTPAAAPVETPQQQTLGMFDLLERLQGLMAANKGNNTDIAALMQSAVSIAQALSKANDPSPYLQKISELEAQVRRQEAEQRQKVLDEIREEVRSLKNPPQTTITAPDGTNISSLIEKAVEKAVEKAGIGEEADTSWWVDPLKQLVPVAIPALMAGLSQLFAPRHNVQPQPQPGAGGFPGPGAPQPQPQLNAPAPQPSPPAQPQPPPQATGVYTTGNPRLDMLLMLIQVPLADFLRDGDSGALFAQDYFIETHGRDLHAEVVQLGTEGITAILYNYPPLLPILKPMSRDKVIKFVDEFVKYNPDNPVPDTEKGDAA